MEANISWYATNILFVQNHRLEMWTLHLHYLHLAEASHSHTDAGGRAGPAHQEQSGVQYLAQGHFDMQTRGIEKFSGK